MHRPATGVLAAVLIVLAAPALAVAATPAAPTDSAGAGHADAAHSTRMLSVRANGKQTSRISSLPVASADGRFVAFTSRAVRLVEGETVDGQQIYLRDTTTDTTTLVSRARGGDGGDGPSDFASISADGMRIVYHSAATDLVADDRNRAGDVFMLDRSTGKTTLLSRAADGDPADGNSSVPVISADGSHVVFVSSASDLSSDDGDFSDVFVRDLTTGATQLVTIGTEGQPANYYSYRAWISGDGRLVSFRSGASNLVVDDSNSRDDAFVRDLASGVTTLISRDRAGVPAAGNSVDPVIAADGSAIAYFSYADGIVAGDRNGHADVFVYDLATRRTTLVSQRGDGVAADGESYYPMISGNGDLVAFTSLARDLVEIDGNPFGDVFVHDLRSGTTVLASLDRSGGPADDGSDRAQLSLDGSTLVFESRANDLVPGDTDEHRPDDVFLLRLG